MRGHYLLYTLIFLVISIAKTERTLSELLIAANLQTAEDPAALVHPPGLSLSLSSGVRVNVSSPTFSDGDLITITYAISAPALPTYGAWLALYSPSNTALNQSAPVKWCWVDDAAYLAHGNGSRVFQLPYMRADYAVYLINGSLTRGVAVGAAAPLLPAGDASAPQRPRLTPVNGSALRVTWGSGRAPGEAAPTFSWGVGAEGAGFSAPVVSSRVGAADLCGAPATGFGWRDLGYTHSAVVDLTALLPARPAVVYYRFGDAVSGLGNATPARVPAAPGGGAFPAVLWALDDLGRGSFDVRLGARPLRHPEKAIIPPPPSPPPPLAPRQFK
jgi:hypothetical protein